MDHHEKGLLERVGNRRNGQKHLLETFCNELRYLQWVNYPADKRTGLAPEP